MNKKIQLKDSYLRNAVKKIIKEEFSKAPESQELVDTKNNKKYLYHATPGCYVSSINKYGLGGKIPKVRFWDYEGTPYEKIEQGCFLATDEYVAESYVEASESFEELSDAYEERYGKEMPIVVFRINVDDLDKNLHKLVEKNAKSLDWHMKQPFGCLQEALYICKGLDYLIIERIFGY